MLLSVIRAQRCRGRPKHTNYCMPGAKQCLSEDKFVVFVFIFSLFVPSGAASHSIAAKLHSGMPRGAFATVQIDDKNFLSESIHWRCGVARGLSQGGNLAERGPLANTQKKNLRNEGETGYGWLY